MNIIIVGAGRVGTNLAQQLAKEHKHRITVIEEDASKCNTILGKLDVLTVNGSGTNPEIMMQSGIADADMLIAVTHHDEVNILSCFLASKFGVPTRVARIESIDFSHNAFDLNELGVTDIIEPEKELANHILEYLYVPETTQVINFTDAHICLRGYRVSLNNKIANKPAKEIVTLTGNQTILHTMIIRNNETIIPSGETVILPGDEILSLMPAEALDDFRTIFPNHGDIGKTVITGSSSTALLLASKLENIASRLILISESETFCREAAHTLLKTEILHGDPASEELLGEASINSADFFVPVDDDSEDNIMAGLLAKADGAGRVIAVTNRDKHTALFKTLGIDHIIHPSLITTQKLFSDISGFSQGSVFSHKKANMELGRFPISSKSNLNGKSVIDLRQEAKSSFIIGCIIREGNFIVAQGNTMITENDELIVFYNTKDIKHITKLFKS